MKRCALFGVQGIVGEQLVILLERGAAAGGVGDDGVEAVRRGRRRCSAAPAAAPRRGSPNARAARRSRSAPRAVQPRSRSSAARGRVASFNRAKLTLAMQPARNADAIAPRTLGRKNLADMSEEEGRFGRRRELLQAAERTQQLQQAQRAHEFLQPAGFIKPQQRTRQGEQRARFQQAPEDEPVHQPHMPRPLHLGGRSARAPLRSAARTAHPRGTPIRSRGTPGTGRCARDRTGRWAHPRPP